MILKLYKKGEILFSLIWIGIYCFSMSFADILSEKIGINSIFSLPVIIILSLILLTFIYKNNLNIKYGLCKPAIPPSKMLFYIPLLILLTVNLRHGIVPNLSIIETLLYIFTMLCVGFYEEILFRGLLFNAMLKDNRNAAVFVSSITFGLGHIINLVNGSGISVTENILQIVSAIAVGYLFVVIYQKSKSLTPCIITHGLFNSLSAFANESTTTASEIFSCIFIVLLSVIYSVLIIRINKNIDN